jgi:hypothetical protein
VKENGEFDNMNENVELFDTPPCYKDLVECVLERPF